MKEPIRIFRKAIFAALNGAVEYDGSVIPVIDTWGAEDISDHFILIGDGSTSNASNKHAFSNDCTCTLQVVTRMKGSGFKAIADDIAESILQIIMPNPQSNILDTNNEMQVLNLKLEGSNYQTENNGIDFIVTKILRLNFRVHQL